MTKEERDYSHLILPVVVAHWKLSFALEQIRPFWNSIPPKIEREFSIAYASGKDWVVTKNDLDSLPDNLWDILKTHISGGTIA